MKIIIYITSYLLFISGIIISISGLLIIFGLSRVFSGIFTGGAQANLLSGVLSIYSIVSGGTVFVGGLLVTSVSHILILLIDIASKK
jgi:hypothetical protein